MAYSPSNYFNLGRIFPRTYLRLPFLNRRRKVIRVGSIFLTTYTGNTTLKKNFTSTLTSNTT
ncbi:MAG: hypothetical protein AABY07_11005, partial [Nanoarchaeota archaeon]